jgi:hypothetical protein
MARQTNAVQSFSKQENTYTFFTFYTFFGDQVASALIVSKVLKVENNYPILKSN